MSYLQNFRKLVTRASQMYVRWVCSWEVNSVLIMCWEIMLRNLAQLVKLWILNSLKIVSDGGVSELLARAVSGTVYLNEKKMLCLGLPLWCWVCFKTQDGFHGTVFSWDLPVHISVKPLLVHYKPASYSYHFSYSHSLYCDEQGHLIGVCPAIKCNCVRELATVKKANVLNMLPECS